MKRPMPQRKKVALLALAICTLNMPFLLLVEHMQGTPLLPVLVGFYVVSMLALVFYVVRELVKLKRGGR
jgi:ABC-type Co2+ transport system permease subunit